MKHRGMFTGVSYTSDQQRTLATIPLFSDVSMNSIHNIADKLLIKIWNPVAPNFIFHHNDDS